MGGIGGPELFLVLVVVLLVFGPKKIPEVARGLGKGLREFRRLSTDFQREINLSAALEEDEKKGLGRPRPGGPGPPKGGAESAPASAGAAGGAASPGGADAPGDADAAGGADAPGGGDAPGGADSPGGADAPPGAATETTDSRRPPEGSR